MRGGGGILQMLGIKSKHLPQPTFDEKDKYKLSNRILTYRFIKSYLDYYLKPNDCLEVKQKGYTIRDIVDLVEQFGSPSSSPLLVQIYKTRLNITNAEQFLIASKVRKGYFNKNDDETKIMKRITEEIIENELSKHFVIMYKSTLCVRGKIEIVDFNELCDGDVENLVKKDEVKNNNDIKYNILFQCFISLATFNNMIGYTYDDAHSRNFLYQANNEEGYYHYRFSNTSFYLKSCPYNICLYDFGEVIQSINPFLIYGAYDRINSYDKIFSQTFNQKTQLTNYYMRNLKNPQFKILFFEEILRLMKLHSPSGMIVDVLPDGAVALNEKPFIISNHKAEGGSSGGSRGIVIKYKSTGEHVHIVYNNKKLKRCVYTKTKGRGKYCKINKIYILLSKLKLVDE
jgi:hypothetical protein